MGLKKGKDKSKAGGAKDNEAQAGADVGKIVNLMSVDANRVSAFPYSRPSSKSHILIKIAMITSGFYFVYGGKRTPNTLPNSTDL